MHSLSPWRIVDDCGGAFTMGAIGGGVFQSIKGFRNAPAVSLPHDGHNKDFLIWVLLRQDSTVLWCFRVLDTGWEVAQMLWEYEPLRLEVSRSFTITIWISDILHLNTVILNCFSATELLYFGFAFWWCCRQLCRMGRTLLHHWLWSGASERERGSMELHNKWRYDRGHPRSTQ